MFNYLQKIDYFSLPIHLRIKNNQYHYTKFGFGLTILFITSLAIITLFFSKDIIYKLHPQSLVFQINTNDPPRIDFQPDKLPIFFYLSNDNDLTIDSSYFYANLTQIVRKWKTFENGERNVSTEFYVSNLISCD